MTASPHRRIAALGAVALALLVAAATVWGLVGDLWRLPIEVVLLGVVVAASWFAVTRTGLRRLVAAVVGLLAIVAAVLLAVAASSLASILVRVALLLAAGPLPRHVVAQDPERYRRDATPGRAVAPGRHPVLIMNLRSGGGKATRFHLQQQCLQRGIEAVVLQPGDDLVELAERAVDRGADVLGMAGGDGSQALVAGVAARRSVAMVVLPAGTRNHLALDLGLDRDDVVVALDAFSEAVEQPMDLAEVNGRVFVNNVSLGLYAAIVRSPEYRDAKVDTTLSALPAALGPGSRPFDLQFAGPDGEPHDGAHIVQVSNNPYGRLPGTRTTRPHLDTGRLGVVALVLRGDRSAAAFLAMLAGNRPERFEGYLAWEPTEFEVTSARAIDVGLDGEALQMAPPLRFTVRPAAVAVRRPTHAFGYSPAARHLSAQAVLRT